MTAETQTESFVRSIPRAYRVAIALSSVLMAVMYWNPLQQMYINYLLTDSYYSHGFLIPPISLYIAWTMRRELAQATQRSDPAGYALLALGAFLLLMGDFLGFMVFQHLSLLPMLIGLSLLLLGRQHTAILWFPLVFLLMMIPLPSSLTQSIALNLKLFAAESAVLIAKAMTLPMVREGSFIYFKDDFLLVGEVCGGLRSLIALFSIGMLMAYYSKSRPWARCLIIALSGPIAIAANVFRILLLCVVGYFWGSEVATGRFHDFSGLLIFAFAFVLFFALEAALRRAAPPKKLTEAISP